MKKVILGVTLSLVMAFATEGVLTVDNILDSVEANENSISSKIEMIQKVYRTDGSVSRSVLTSYSGDEGDKALMVYNEPAQINGMKILQLNDGDDIWFYSPRTGRTRKIASHQKNQSVNGSDFSYDDMSTEDQREDYTAKMIGTVEVQGVQCFTIELTLKEESDKEYSKIIMNVDMERWLPLTSEFYDEIGEIWKVLTLSEITREGNYWSAGMIEMKNIQKGTRTEMITESVIFDLELDMGMFTERYLSR